MDPSWPLVIDGYWKKSCQHGAWFFFSPPKFSILAIYGDVFIFWFGLCQIFCSFFFWTFGMKFISHPPMFPRKNKKETQTYKTHPNPKKTSHPQVAQVSPGFHGVLTQPLFRKESWLVSDHRGGGDLQFGLFDSHLGCQELRNATGLGVWDEDSQRGWDLMAVCVKKPMACEHKEG